MANALAANVGGAGGTVFTGDVIQGKRVISALDGRDLKPGRKHLFYFRGVQTVTGAALVRLGDGRQRGAAVRPPKWAKLPLGLPGHLSRYPGP